MRSNSWKCKFRFFTFYKTNLHLSDVTQENVPIWKCLEIREFTADFSCFHRIREGRDAKTLAGEKMAGLELLEEKNVGQIFTF